MRTQFFISGSAPPALSDSRTGDSRADFGDLAEIGNGCAHRRKVRDSEDAGGHMRMIELDASKAVATALCRRVAVEPKRPDRAGRLQRK
jgi:hypothetical protein